MGRRILKDISKVIKFPATRREILDQLQLSVVFEDRIELEERQSLSSITTSSPRIRGAKGGGLPK
jgi:hypothetical protein